MSEIRDKIKNEIVQEIGYEVPKDHYYGHIPSRVLGAIGFKVRCRMKILKMKGLI